MTISKGVHYLASKDSINGHIKSGDTIFYRGMSLWDGTMEEREKSGIDPMDYTTKVKKFELFLKPTENQPSFFGMKAMNNVQYFLTKQEMMSYIEGTEPVLNIELAKTIIATKEEELRKLKETYSL